MANELDPHYMVALMSCVVGSGGDGSPRRSDPSLQSSKHGIVDNHEINIRTFPVLDALAHISVSQEGCQVVAIALQLDSQKQKIHLTVAENQDVTDGLISHLQDIWGKLQKLSDLYAKQRTKNAEDPLEKSPEIPPKVAIPLKIQIFSEIYRYSLEKQMKRIEKWSQRLCDFITKLLQRRKVTGLQGLEQNLYSAAAALVLVVELVTDLDLDPENTLTDVEWEAIYLYSMQANSDARLLLDIDDGLDCEALALEIHDSGPGNPFPLQRALQKLTSLTCHIESLIGFAHSPRLRPALQYEMSISSVPNQPRNVQLPQSRVEWKSFLETAYGGHQKVHGVHAVKLSQKFQWNNYVCPVHCECALIQYLQGKHDDDWGSIPVFSYIGVSKLSCGACRIWIKASNEQGGPEFFTRGSHGKWYWPWGMPRGGSLEKNMAQKVYQEYLTHMRLADPRQRTRSDSSGASSSGAQHTLADDDLARTKAAALQGFEGNFSELALSKLSHVIRRRGGNKGAKRRGEPRPSETFLLG